MAKTNCTKNGNDYFRIKRKVGRKLNKQGIWVDAYKEFYGKTKKEALEKYEKYLAEQQLGDKAKKCVGEVIDQWVETVFLQDDLAEGTKINYYSAYKNHFRDKTIAGKLITEITPLDMQQFYNENQDVIAYSSMQSLNKFLKRFFQYCDLNGYCRNIMQSVTVPAKKKIDVEDFDTEISVWEDDDLKKVIDHLEGSTKRLFVVLAVNTGARLAELLALTYDDIKDNLLYINKQLREESIDGKIGFHLDDTKTASSIRVIPLTDKVMDEVRKHTVLHKEEMLQNNYRTNYIFTTSTGKFYYRRTLQQFFERLYRRIEVPYHKIHDFRHTFGTNLSRAEVPIEETSKLMGHSSIEVTSKYYINVDVQRKLKAVEKITAFSL